MDARELPARPRLELYERLAADLALAYGSGDAEAIRRIQEHYELPRAPAWEELRADAQQRLRKLRGSESASSGLSPADARLLVARSHGFLDWQALADHVEAANREGSSVSQFEAAADAVVAGDGAALEELLRKNPELVRARSTRLHGSTLLHYVSANGVEDFRQQTPENAVAVAKTLLAAGAQVDAENEPGRGTTLGLVATSVHPLLAGVQIALLETLLDAGAAVDGAPGGWNPVLAALANGRGEAAAFLAARGARLDLEAAAGVGRLDLVERFFTEDGRLRADATRAQMLSGFAWACEYGRTSVVDFLLRRGIEVDEALEHNGQTGLHWAAYCGRLDTVRLLLQRNAPVDVKDKSFGGTPLGWALYGWGEPAPEAERSHYYEVVALLVASGATLDREWLADPDRELPLVEKLRADPRMRAALEGGGPKRKET